MWSPPLKMTRYWSALRDVIVGQAAIGGLDFRDAHPVVLRPRQVQAGHFDRPEGLVQVGLAWRRGRAHDDRRLDARVAERHFLALGRHEHLADDGLGGLGPERVPGHADLLQVEPALEGRVVVVQLCQLVQGEADVERAVEDVGRFAHGLAHVG